MPQQHHVREKRTSPHRPTPRRRSAKPCDLLGAKLAVPAVRAGIVTRPGLVNRLRAARTQQVVTIVAPAGYGKTTLLAQWAERDERPFAWVSVDEEDNEPFGLLRYVAAALHRVEPVALAVFDALADRGDASPSAALPRLADALSSVSAPVVLVLDDVQLLRTRESAKTIATLARHLTAGSTLVLAGRELPDLPIARLRAAGRLLEIDAAELPLSRRESHLVLRAAQVELDEADLGDLAERTEGWAAGIHLAGVFLRDGNGRRHSVSDFTGADRFVADYFRFEHLSRLGPAGLRFLTRSSVLDSMSGPLCDAVVGRGRRRSAGLLESLERSSLFVFPLDRRRDRYRYHRLFRETLRAELDRLEPELVPELNRRAAAWCEANGAPEEARRYAAAAGDLDTVARLVTAHAPQAYCDGRVGALESWLDGLDDPALLERHPAAAAVGSWIHALRGRAAEAEHWLDIAGQGSARGRLPDGTPSLEPWLAFLRAAACRDGADRMLADAEAAAAGLARASRWRPLALCLRAVAHLLLGANDEADALLAEAAEMAAAVEALDVQLLALGERSLLAAASNHELAEDLADQARAVGGDGRRGTPPASAISLAALARAELRGGRWEQARAHIEEATRLLPQLTHALPWCSVQTSLELARARMALLDTAGAWTLLDHAESILRRRPALGVLAEQARDLRAELTALQQDDARRGSVLTAAELRLLPLLTTRLSFREIGERLHVSRNTVKTQAIAVYRKLGVSSRNDAIDRAAELGLLAAATQPLPPG